MDGARDIIKEKSMMNEEENNHDPTIMKLILLPSKIREKVASWLYYVTHQTPWFQSSYQNIFMKKFTFHKII